MLNIEPEVKAVHVDLVTTWMYGEMSPPLPYHIRLLISLSVRMYPVCISFYLCFRDIGYMQTGNIFQCNYLSKSVWYYLNRISIYTT